MYNLFSLPHWAISTPVTILYHGSFWVVVFFIISGFVLTLKYFKTQKQTCVTGGTFRRYIRLMIPLWVIISLYYFVLRMQFDTGKNNPGFARFQDKVFVDMVFDGVFHTWYGDFSWAVPTWSLSVELTASYIVYLVV
jgi:peptidoglycan/LPS O-acetylase OafA/YrhL